MEVIMRKTQDIYVKLFLVVAVCCCVNLQTQAFLWWGNEITENGSEVQVKQGIIGTSIPFSIEDFWDNEKLESITMLTLPQDYFGILMLDNQPVQAQQVVPIYSLNGLQFQSKSTIGKAEFQYIPNYFDGTTGNKCVMTFEIVDKPNMSPVAVDMELFTYKNIEIVCYFDVSDEESDYLTFQIVDSPARGSVTILEGTSSFLYTPYENKVGKDKFSYLVTDSYGNASNEAVVQIQIEKANTPVNYGDMQGHPSHKSAIALAEAGIFAGECVGNTYLFSPEQTVSRQEFLSLAMAVVEMAPLEDVTTTGFYDDDAIATWSKGYVSSALLAGVIEGSQDQEGRAVFQGESPITLAEASVMLNQLLEVTPTNEVNGYHWASQASANLSAVGVTATNSGPLPASLNRGEVAELLDGALALMKTRKDTWLVW